MEEEIVCNLIESQELKCLNKDLSGEYRLETNEKPSVIQTRCRQCTTFLFFLPFNPLHLVRDQRNIILKGVPKRVAASGMSGTL